MTETTFRARFPNKRRGSISGGVPRFRPVLDESAPHAIKSTGLEATFKQICRAAALSGAPTHCVPFYL